MKVPFSWYDCNCGLFQSMDGSTHRHRAPTNTRVHLAILLGMLHRCMLKTAGSSPLSHYFSINCLLTTTIFDTAVLQKLRSLVITTIQLSIEGAWQLHMKESFKVPACNHPEYDLNSCYKPSTDQSATMPHKQFGGSVTKEVSFSGG